MRQMSDDVQPGLLVLHGNRTELLGEAVFDWLARQPLRPLEQEIFLVQSNGVAEWLKMALASQGGIFAAARVELPGRFLWRAYRQMLGRDAVPLESAMDKLPLTWRLMRHLPELAQAPGFEPLAGFLRQGEMDRRLQLAQRLADLYDQYQVYRDDWLAAWAVGDDSLPSSAPGAARVLPGDQRWQAMLWRELLAPLDKSQRAGIRSQLNSRFMAALGAGASPVAPLARRVVLFGMSQVPMQTLQALAALSTHCQVLLAIPNPCRYHWADTIAGRELLQLQRHRHPLRRGRDLADVPLEQMHAHAHPLLAAWGRQGRDFVRQLDAFDDAQLAQQRFPLAKVDLFDDAPGRSLLQQVQASIRDLVPLAEQQRVTADIGDRSIVFHIAHSVQREVEILHDQLLALLADPPEGRPLQPREIVVMVPDIARFAPAVRAVFGQPGRGDARFIPFDIADLAERGNNPLLIALEWLLRLPQQRCRLSELRDLLDVPALAQRFGLQAGDLPRLNQWMEGAGIRWGLNAAQRAEQGLAACGDQNSWLFGLRRMLLGYAVGEPGPNAGALVDATAIEPYAEVGGLEASIAGSLAALVDALQQWSALAAIPATPTDWAARGLLLLSAMIAPTDERERLTVAALQASLADWLAACETAGFDQPVPLAVAREAWLTGIDEPALSRRFKSGGVTFCTLLPMRALPFEVLCLLGMNDGDFPRSSARSDFDLMAWPGQQRPGDRSRRDDDRQLMLEALLSARRVLYVSWAGRSARDNSEQPPSVLVSQLRDYLAAGWAGEVLAERTTEHPLQPFSRRYFELPGTDLFTHAREWRAAHVAPLVSAQRVASVAPDLDQGLTVTALAAFLRNPVRHFFRTRLGVVFGDATSAAPDEESFGLDGLTQYNLLSEVLDQVIASLPELAGRAASGNAPDLRPLVAAQLARIARAGRLPMAESGDRTAQALVEDLLPMLAAWRSVCSLYPQPCAKLALRYTQGGLAIDDWLDGLRAAPAQAGLPVWLELSASRFCDRQAVRPDKLITGWIRTLVSSACGTPARGVIVGRDASVTLEPLPTEQARAALDTLLQAWREGLAGPLPLACRTGFALLSGSDAVASVYEGSRYPRDAMGGEVDDPCLARLYPDFESLSADGRFADLADRLLQPIAAWARHGVSFERHAVLEPAVAADGGDDG